MNFRALAIGNKPVKLPSRTAAILLPALLVACGGGGGSGGGITFPLVPAPTSAPAPAPAAPTPPVVSPPVAPPAPTPTTLSSSVSKIALSVNAPGVNAALTGTPRTITITNSGTYEAKAVTYTVSPALPSGTTITPSACGPITSGGTCVLTVTPGATPSAAPTDIAPVPIVLSIQGENTDPIATEVSILAYGSVYQGGYVYSLDDSTGTTSSAGGKVLALSLASAGEIWGPDGALLVENFIDGRAATQAIVAQFPGQASAAKTCMDSTLGGYADWYLPVMRELTGGAQTIFSNLFVPYPGTVSSGFSWLADSRYFSNPVSVNTATSYDPKQSAIFFMSARSLIYSTRCMRDLT